MPRFNRSHRAGESATVVLCAGTRDQRELARYSFNIIRAEGAITGKARQTDISRSAIDQRGKCARGVLIGMCASSWAMTLDCPTFSQRAPASR